MKKGSFDLTGKAIDCSGLPALGDAGKEIFRALKATCGGVDNPEYGQLEGVSDFSNGYLILYAGIKLLTDDSGTECYNLEIIQPSDVLGQGAIDAAKDGATIVFEGDNLPLGRVNVYYSDGGARRFLIDSPSQQSVNFDIIAYKPLDEKQPSIESLILAEKLGTGQPIVETAQPSTGWIKTIGSGAKHDAGKPLYNLIPVHAEAELVDVLTFGANKYAPNQWRNVENATDRYTAAAMRHLAAYRMGETHDNESGKHHLAHAMCCLAFIVELDLEDNE